jgi:pyruvate dehydrogenase E1 component alpha subunit
MVRIRLFEARVSAVAAAKEVDGYVHTYAGEEAVAAGIIPLLGPRDWLTSTYRNHGHSIARGVPLTALAGELYGKSTGVCHGKGGSMHAVDQDLGMLGGMGIVAGGLPMATGVAFAAQYLGQDRVAVSFFGDGAVHQGAWHEALDFAAMFHCPVLFVCENNLYAETTAVDYHLRTKSVAEMATPYRIPATTVDGMDLFAVREAAETALQRAHAGGGPTLIEAMTYRYGGQYEGDTQTYKPPAEVEQWRARDPLPHFRAKATDRILKAHQLDRVVEEVTDEVKEAFAAAQAAPWPSLSELTTDVYTSYP